MWHCKELQPAVESRSDIENVWTLAVFLVPSCLAVAVLLVQYLILHTPLSQAASWDVNPVDVVVLQWVRGVLRLLGLSFHHLDQPSRDNSLRAVFDQFMLSLGDIHASFAIAIIGYGFVSLPRGLTAYDWWIMVGLAWLAVVTNIAVLSCLRDFFRTNPAKRGWRLCLVFAMVAILAFCMIPVVRIKQAMSLHRHESDRDILAANAMCFFPGRGHIFPSQDINELLLRLSIIVGFLAIVAALSLVVMIIERPHGILGKWCDHYRGEVREVAPSEQLLCARCEQRFILLVMRPFVAFWLTIRAHLDLLNSVLTEITCTVALLAWVTLRLWQLLQVQPFQAPESVLGLAQSIAIVSLLAPLKPLVEYVCLNCTDLLRLVSFRYWFIRRRQKPESFTSCEDIESQTNKERTSLADPSLPGIPSETCSNQGRPKTRPRASYTPLHFKFYLDTAWYVKALPVVGVSALVQLLLIFVLSTTSSKPAAAIVLQLAPWYVLFTPVQALLYSLCAMVTEERGGVTEVKRRTYWGLSAMFGLLSAAAAFDTVYGLGGFPMSYIGMATTGLMVVVYVLYGCVSKPGRHVKGKGTNSGEIDEESALLGSKIQVRIPVRRPKHLHGPSRRLSKQSIKTYGTMATKSSGTSGNTSN